MCIEATGIKAGYHKFILARTKHIGICLEYSITFKNEKGGMGQMRNERERERGDAVITSRPLTGFWR